ncbi:tetratricopeptide repeat protein [Pseudactinotalea sp. Z1732]|uniref:tetratricopeptide repeat protein n=1 Tax=Micrococcales TaxID=85006 RepID=UPI003C7B6E9C
MVNVSSTVDVADLDLGGGYRIRGSDLRGEVTDLAAFRAAAGDDPAAEVIIALSEERFDDALQELDELHTKDPDSVRYQALRADVLRDQGQLDAAEAIYTDLLARAGDDPVRSAVIRQHRAKVWFHQGRLRDAEAEFAEVLALREAAGVDEGQLASTRQSLQRLGIAVAMQDAAE